MRKMQNRLGARFQRTCAVALTLLAGALSAPAGAVVITVEGTNTVGTSNCIAFGCPGQYDPFMGFVYKNLAAFSLNAGDKIAFDTANVQNDNPLQFNIFLGATTVNGGTVLNGGLTQITIAQTPADPDGNTIAGDYELVFTVGSAFNFAGGGLVIAFNPTGPSLADTSGDQNLVHSDASDASGLFVGRFYGRGSVPNGSDLQNGPSGGFDPLSIANFRITTGQAPEPASLALLGLGLAGLGLSRRRKA